MQPMLIDQFKYLYSMVTEADQVLGKDAYDRYKELSLQLEKITQEELTLNWSTKHALLILFVNCFLEYNLKYL